MKTLRLFSLFLLFLTATPCLAWEKVCSFEGGGLGEVNFLTISLYRKPRGNGRWDYMINFPVNISPRCPPLQHARGKVSAKFYMTKNVSFDSGTVILHSGASELKKVFEDQLYLECIDSDYSWERECRY